MNTLVIYDSQYGNTERIARAIADTLCAFGQAQVARVDPAHPGFSNAGHATNSGDAVLARERLTRIASRSGGRLL